MWLVGGPLVVFLLAFGLFILIEGPGVWAVPSLPFVVKVTLVARLLLQFDATAIFSTLFYFMGSSAVMRLPQGSERMVRMGSSAASFCGLQFRQSATRGCTHFPTTPKTWSLVLMLDTSKMSLVLIHTSNKVFMMFWLYTACYVPMMILRYSSCQQGGGKWGLTGAGLRVTFAWVSLCLPKRASA